MKTLILGGMRSGKTRLAQRLATESGLDVVYLATAQAGDAEMQSRIARHRDDRPARWLLVEEPLALASALHRVASPTRCVIVDCLTLWLTNLLLQENSQRFQQERQALIDCLPALPGRVILVSNETGLGVVPMGELTRRYCDEAGWLHQDIAAICDEVTLTIAGLPLALKSR